MNEERRPTMWEQSAGQPYGDLCQMCQLHGCRQLKARVPGGWQVCPHCDRGLDMHRR